MRFIYFYYFTISQSFSVHVFIFTFVIMKTVQKFKNQVKNWKKEELQHEELHRTMLQLHDIISDWRVL